MRSTVVYHCPVEVTMDVLAGKWTTVVLAHIKEAPRRFSELGRLIPDISEKVLSQRLRTLEAEGIVVRTVVSDTPPHVVYDLTPEGRSLGPALQALYEWGNQWAEHRGLQIQSPGG